MSCLHLARIAVFPHIAGLRKRVIALLRLWTWISFLGFSLKLVECFLGDSEFVHNRSSSRALLAGLILVLGVTAMRATAGTSSASSTIRLMAAAGDAGAPGRGSTCGMGCPSTSGAAGMVATAMIITGASVIASPVIITGIVTGIRTVIASVPVTTAVVSVNGASREKNWGKKCQ